VTFTNIPIWTACAVCTCLGGRMGSSSRRCSTQRRGRQQRHPEHLHCYLLHCGRQSHPEPNIFGLLWVQRTPNVANFRPTPLTAPLPLSSAPQTPPRGCTAFAQLLRQPRGVCAFRELSLAFTHRKLSPGRTNLLDLYLWEG